MGIRNLPAGTVTFLFSDVEGSTRLLEALGADAYADALATHRRALRRAFADHGGVEVDTQGDAFFVAFPTAQGALAAARQATAALADGPIRVRIGLHTGTPLLADEGYIGPDVHKGARIGAAGHGGQILLSRETRELVEGEFTDLGEHRVKGFAAPVWIHQLGTRAFPPLSTISNTNLPQPRSPLIGREREIAEVVALIDGGARLVTLAGPGGTGKTRLAVAAAAQLLRRFRSGVFWVEAAPMTEPAVVIQAMEQVLGARDGLAEHIGERQVLVLVDNLEQVLAVGPELARLVERCPNLCLLLTSRERLRVRGEREYRVPALALDEAVALYHERSGTTGDDPDVAALVAALDNMPLAIELSASRANVLSPAQMRERLTQRLDLFRGGRDSNDRHATLRATIDWSHDLLINGERALFARLAVFRGGCTLDAAEAVADAYLDTLGSLVDKSLVRRTDGRFSMLESIRLYAEERLAEMDDAAEHRRRHADHYAALVEAERERLDAGEPEEGPVAAMEREMDNVRSAVEFALSTGDAGLVRQITAALPMYWLSRGAFREALSWLERAIALAPDARDDVARRLHAARAAIAYATGDHRTAVAEADTAAAIAGELAGTGERAALLREQAVAALMHGELEKAERLFLERLPLALESRNWVAASSCRINLAALANQTGRHDRARELLEENLPFVRSRGQTRCEANTLVALAETTVRSGGRSEAAADAWNAARLALEIGEVPLALYALDLLAAAAARQRDPRAATLLAGTGAIRRRMELEPDPDDEAIRAVALADLGPDAPSSDASSAVASAELPQLLALGAGLVEDLRDPAALAVRSPAVPG